MCMCSRCKKLRQREAAYDLAWSDAKIANAIERYKYFDWPWKKVKP